MAASSNFEASRFTEAVMQTNFEISHDLLRLNILSFIWHFCIYFGEHKLPFYISTAPCLKKFDVFYFSRDHTIEVSRDFLGGSPSFWFSTLPSFGDLTRDHVIDVPCNFVGEVPSP